MFKYDDLEDLLLSDEAKEIHKNCNHIREARGNSFVYYPPEGCSVPPYSSDNIGYKFNEIPRDIRKKIRGRKNTTVS